MNLIILKWGSLKAYEFSDEFLEKHKNLVEELNNIWNSIYSNNSGAMSGSQYLQSNDELKNKLVDLLEYFYNLGVPFQNGWTDEYFNNYQEIRDYILNY